MFYEETRGDIQTYCILDRDFHTKEEIDDLHKKAEESHLILHIWNRKEIENYLVSPKAIFRMIGFEEKDWDKFYGEFMDVTDSLRSSTLSSKMDYLSTLHRSKTPSAIMNLATELLKEPWSSLDGRLSVVNGKDLLSTVNSWLREKYKVKSSRDKLIKSLSPDDIPQEIKDVINMLTC